MTEVYIDLDGVLADFFSSFAKLAGEPSGNYRKLHYTQENTIKQIAGTDFFYTLPKFDTTDELIYFISEVYGSYIICSSPADGDWENSSLQKQRWVNKHLSPLPSKIIITTNKAKYAVTNGSPNILIDDRGSNISAWEAAGGIGIKYQADEDPLSVIVDGLVRASKILKNDISHDPLQLKSLNRSTGEYVHHSANKDGYNEVVESASAGATGAGAIASAVSQGGGWLFGGNYGGPKKTKKSKSKVIKRE